MKFNKLLYIYFLLFITIFNSSCSTEELNDIANNAGSQTIEVAPAFVDTIAPTAPSGLITTSKSSNSIVISWDASTDNVAVSGYRVYRNDSFISTTTSTNYIDNTVSANSTYNYVISAFDAVNNAAVSNTLSVNTPAAEVPPVFVDTISPTVPSGLVTTSNSSSSIAISWSASTDNVGVTGYRVSRNGSLISTITSTSYIDNTVSANSTYNYVVSAFDSANNSTASNVLTVNTPAQISASDINVKISWQVGDTGGSPSSGFYVYYGKESGNLTNYIDVGMTTLVILSGVDLANGEDIQFDGSNTYYFSVVSYDADKILFSPHSEEKIANL